MFGFNKGKHPMFTFNKVKHPMFVFTSVPSKMFTFDFERLKSLAKHLFNVR